MVRVDLNKISIVGLLLGGVALVLLLLESRSEESWTVARVLGPNAPLARVSIWMVFAVVGVLVYLTGRLLFLARNRFGMPEPLRRERDRPPEARR
jgi:hypothetical protein